MKIITNNIPQGYKDSPLGIIPKEWEVKKISASYRVQGGYAFKSDLFTNKGIAIIRISNISTHRNINLSDCIYYPITKYIETQFKIKFGDILIALSGATTGKSAMYCLDTAAYLNQRVGCFKQTNSTIDNLFLYYWIDSNKFQKQLSLLLIAGAQPNVSPKDLENIKIPVPPLPEQQKIAEVLSTWNKAIEKQSQLIEKLELRKKGLMQQLLTGKKRLPGFSSKWKTIKLGDISKRIVRRNINEQCTNVVTISAQKGFIRQTDFFNKKVASETIENYYLVKRNEFCYNKSYSNGFPMGAIKRLKEFDQAVVTTLYICFAVQEERISVDFIEQYFSLGQLNRGLMKIANEGGRAHGLLNVTPNDFFNINLNLPPIDEQKAISSILFNAYNEVVLAKNKIKSLQEQKKGLMQVLLTGKKRIIQ